MKVVLYPELDQSDILNDKEHNRYQKILGVAQQIITSVRFDICHAVASLSRFAAVSMARHMLGYLKKIPKKQKKAVFRYLRELKDKKNIKKRQVDRKP